MEIIASAPGKLILFGEHASSRNRPAIVFAVNRRLEVKLIPNKERDNEILITSESLGILEEPYPSEKLDLVSKTITTFFEETQTKVKPFDLIISSKIEAGFGSSAAVIVATLGALDCYYKTNLSKFDLLKLGLKANYAIKGYGSGLDIGAAIYGGLIKYQKGVEPINLDFSNLHLVIGNTGINAKSGPIVEAVKEFEQCNTTLS